MQTVIGLFTAQHNTQSTVGRLRAAGFTSQQLNVFFPGDAGKLQISSTKSEIDDPDAGQAIWALTGGGFGALAGMSIATFALPGVGLVSAVGLIAVATLATAGAVGGALAGAAVESGLENALPPAEFEAYKDALRSGNTIIFVRPLDAPQAEVARRIMMEDDGQVAVSSGTQWLSMLRVADAPQPGVAAHDLASEEVEFRRGFEVAQLSDIRDSSYEDALPYLRNHFPQDYQNEAFRRGFERGAQHRLAYEHPHVKP